MQVHKDINNLPKFRNAVITIGTFDGVHSGHQQIIRQLKEEASRIGGETVIVTFDPHPRKIVNNQTSLQLLNTLEERIELLESMQIDHLVVTPFTREFSEQPAELYIRDFLVEKFHPHTIIIGYDHRFGKGREGDYRTLEKYAPTFSFCVHEIPEQVLDAVTVSSTRIRKALLEGDVLTAKELLGYDYFFEGKVIEGNKLGRTLGYPTANLEINSSEKLVPGNGVYAVRLALMNGSIAGLKGMMNIGFRPTIDGSKRTIEVNIFDFDQDIYGKNLKVYLVKFLRAEQKFKGLDALKEQLAIDKLESEASLQE